MTYPNILRNPTLKTNDEVLQVEEIAVPGYPPQYIWHPTDWKTTVTPTMKGLYAKRMTDLQIIPTVWPQSVNGQRVLTIEANTKHFVVKLEQSAIALKSNQRYLIKVLFTPAVQIVGEANPADLAWRIMINRGEIVLTDGFQNADAISEWGQPRSILMVIHSHEVQTVDLAVEFWSKFGNLDKQIYIHSVEMLEVEADYGDGGNVHFLGTPQTEILIPDPDPLPDDTTLPTAPGWVFALMLFVCACVILALVYTFANAPNRAQEVTSMEIISITEAGNILMAAIGAILAGGLAAPVTQPIVNVLKYILKLVGQENLISGNGLSLLVAAVVSFAIWLSRHFGVELQATNVMDWLTVALPIVLSGLSMFLSQKGMFALSQRFEIPVFGYTRSE